MHIHSHGRYPVAQAPTDAVGRKRMEILEDIVGDQVELSANLARLDTGALAFAQAQGMKFVVVHPGDRLEQTGALRQQDAQKWLERMPELKELGDAVFAHQAEARALDSLLRATGKPLTVCGNGFSPMHPDRHLDPEAATVAEWAAWHGADTPQEVALFKDLLKGINGERLGEGKLNTVTHGLLAPEVYFYGPKDNRMLLDRYDRDAVLLWQGSQGQVVADSSQAADGGARGQLFPDVNRILIRDRALNGDRTAVHELAHGLDFLLEKQAPEWYKGWKEQLEQAFGQARQRGTITDYAKANAREYLAEGVAHCIFEKEKLQQVDPVLARLSQAMLEKASQMAGIDPELERSHLTLLAATQEQVTRALQAAATNPEQSRQELSGASVQLKKSVASMKSAGRQSATQMLQFGMLSGAVDGVLHYVLRQTPPEVSGEQTQALQQANQADPIETAFLASESGQRVARGETQALGEEFQLAYLAGAALAYRMQG